VALRALSPDSIMAQISCKDSAPPKDDMLNCSADVSRSDDMRFGDVAASECNNRQCQELNILLQNFSLTKWCKLISFNYPL